MSFYHRNATSQLQNVQFYWHVNILSCKTMWQKMAVDYVKIFLQTKERWLKKWSVGAWTDTFFVSWHYCTTTAKKINPEHWFSTLANGHVIHVVTLTSLFIFLLFDNLQFEKMSPESTRHETDSVRADLHLIYCSVLPSTLFRALKYFLFFGNMTTIVLICRRASACLGVVCESLSV